MALAFNQLTEGRSTTDPSSTASVTPTNGGIVWLAFAIQVAANDPADSVSVSGNGLTWTKVGTVAWSTRRRSWVYRGEGTPSSGAITIDYTGAQTFQSCQWSVDETTGQDNTTPNDTAVTASNSAVTSLAVGDVGTPNAGDFVYGICSHTVAESVTAEGTYTVLTNITATAPTLLVQYDGNATPDETPSASWTTADSCGAIGFIINVASGATAAANYLTLLGAGA